MKSASYVFLARFSNWLLADRIACCCAGGRSLNKPSPERIAYAAGLSLENALTTPDTTASWRRSIERPLVAVPGAPVANAISRSAEVGSALMVSMLRVSALNVRSSWNSRCPTVCWSTKTGICLRTCSRTNSRVRGSWTPARTPSTRLANCSRNWSGSSS